MEGWSRQIVMMLLSEEGDSTVRFMSTISHSRQAQTKNELHVLSFLAPTGALVFCQCLFQTDYKEKREPKKSSHF